MRSTRFSLMTTMMVALPLYASSAFAAKPFFALERGGTSLLSPKEQAWHDQYEKNGDYGESWFFMGYAADGGVFFALMSITNLGVHTFDGVVDVQYYPPTGSPAYLHKEYRRADIKASTSEMDIHIGPNRTWGKGGAYHLLIAEPGFRFEVHYRNKLPKTQVNNGKVDFYEDRSAMWSLGIHSPRAAVTGTLQHGGKNYDVSGNGYHDHGWSTIKVPTFCQKWYAARIFDPELTIIMHKLYLQKKFGSKLVQLGVLGTSDKLLGTTRNFKYNPTKWRKDKKSGNQIPTEVEVTIESGGTKVSGKLTEAQFLDSIDVLAQVSWPVRMAIKMFYSNPYMVRYLAKYELELTQKDGTSKQLSGFCVLEANEY